MNNPIELLRCLAIATACTVHDEEALSALELSGRTAAKVNECVKLVNDTCEKLDKQLYETLKEALKFYLENGELETALDGIIESVLGGSY